MPDEKWTFGLSAGIDGAIGRVGFGAGPVWDYPSPELLEMIFLLGNLVTVYASALFF